MADKLKLRLIDDNPMVLGMFPHASSSRPTVCDAPDALLKAVDDDPGGGEAEPASSETASASVAATASVPVSRKKDEEEDVVLDG